MTSCDVENTCGLSCNASASNCEIHWTEEILRVRVVERISSGALLEAARLLAADARYKKLRFFLVDFLDARWGEASLLDALEKLLPIFSSASSGHGGAQIGVISQDPYIVELADAIVRFRSEERPPVHVFVDRSSANGWVTQTLLQ